jgi:hypothetical protein
LAVSHAQYILEEMQNTANRLKITSTDWDTWAKAQNIATLPGESFQVLYADPRANPLDIQVNVQWQMKNGVRGVQLTTILNR